MNPINSDEVSNDETHGLMYSVVRHAMSTRILRRISHVTNIDILHATVVILHARTDPIIREGNDGLMEFMDREAQ